MSALVDVAPTIARPRAPLTVVTPTEPDAAPRRWLKGLYPAAVLVLLAGGLIGHLVLQTTIQEQAFALSDLQAQAKALSAQQSILEAAIDQVSAPDRLAAQAAGLGMVADPYTTYVNVTTGEVTGVNKAVTGRELPIISAPPVIAANGASVDAAQQAAQPDTPPTDAGVTP